MGVAVSGWRLAKAVSKMGQLGVVSGTALELMPGSGAAGRAGEGD